MESGEDNGDSARSDDGRDEDDLHPEVQQEPRSEEQEQEQAPAQEEIEPVRLSVKGAPAHLRPDIVRAQNARVCIFQNSIASTHANSPKTVCSEEQRAAEGRIRGIVFQVPILPSRN